MRDLETRMRTVRGKQLDVLMQVMTRDDNDEWTINRCYPCGHNLNIRYSTNEYSCSFCNENESLEHYFYSCPYVKRFWKSFMNWWKTIYDCYIQLNVLDILFGIVNENNDNMIGCLNFCILLAKRYIKSVHENGNKDYFIYDFQIEIKNSIDIEEYIYTKNDQKEIFERKWNFFREHS